MLPRNHPDYKSSSATMSPARYARWREARLRSRNKDIDDYLEKTMPCKKKKR